MKFILCDIAITTGLALTIKHRAVDADVLLLNEIGLDPGIDHCSAVSLIDKLQSEGKQIVSFTSFCGGLPAPEFADGVPLGYKFSWSPKGVLSAALNGATYKVVGQVSGGRFCLHAHSNMLMFNFYQEHHIEGEDILDQYFPDVPISSVMKLDGIANRNSLPYADTYGLQLSNIRTMFRGTLR